MIKDVIMRDIEEFSRQAGYGYLTTGV
jgi:hypothetical protein